MTVTTLRRVNHGEGSGRSAPAKTVESRARSSRGPQMDALDVQAEGQTRGERHARSAVVRCSILRGVDRVDAQSVGQG